MPRLLQKAALLLLASYLLPPTAYLSAQEIAAKVSIQHARIQNADPNLFKTMERAVSDFINTRKWTADEYGPSERIEVSVMMNITKRLDANDDIYEAHLNIQAARPVFNTGYATPTVNFVDRDVQFKYSQFNPLQFDDNRVTGGDALSSNLTAVLAYYTYLILGLDYESFQKDGGTPFYKKAQNIVLNAPEHSTIVGWKAAAGARNRFWITDQMLNPRFAAFHTYWYSYHREGMDNLYIKPEEAREKILAGIPELTKLARENPASVLLQFFFSAKADEYLRILGSMPRESRATYAAALMSLDVPNTRKYEALK